MIISDPHIRDRIVRNILAERLRQNALVESGVFPYNCADVDIPDSLKLPVLIEEAGEVAKAVYELSAFGGRDNTPLINNLRIELVQVAAVALAWIEAIDNDIV
jgi:hypothetical protein